MAGGTLEVSKTFDCCKVDWKSGNKGIGRDAASVSSREQFFARHATLLSDKPDEQKLITDSKAPIRLLEYDWGLNLAK